ncbi:hypothetical protein [Micromonospora sp. S4605]|uniref:hypothetical protein n=1 Tax=Micromonospora sp. S4605 TaxID=1420897 RepID=UPI0011B42F69|nr:hypothetical protein [Micromonospora sp. S4605]
MDLDKQVQIRLRERWQALQITEEAVDRLLEIAMTSPEPPEVPHRGVVLITGALGIGKSTYADVKMRRNIQEAFSTETARWPVLIDARTLADTPLETKVLEAAKGLPVAAYTLIVDGCDELPRDIANGLLRDARLFYGSSPESLIVLLSRPGYISWRDEVHLPELTEDAAESVMEAAAGHEVRIWSLPSQLRPLIRRPLFAILAARYFGAGHPRPTTSAGLLSALVEDVLRRDTATNEAVFAKLRDLAKQTMTHGGWIPETEVGSIAIRESLISTRLVVARSGSIGFAAPVIEQYFAALALLRNEIDAIEHTRSLSAWERWRPAWALAVTIGSWSQVAALVAQLASTFPGAAAWLVGENVADNGLAMLPAGESTSPLPPDSELSSRMTTAFKTWAASFSEVARVRGVLDGYEGRRVRIIVRSSPSSGLYVAGWSGTAEPSEAEIARSRDILAAAEPGWFFRGAWREASHPTWPWRFTLDRFGKMVERHLSHLRWNPGVQALGVEAEWDLIYSLAPSAAKSAIRRQDYEMAAKLTRRSIDSLAELLTTENIQEFHLDRRFVTVGELEALRGLIRDADPSQVFRSPWPGPDTDGGGSWVWSSYSLDRLAERSQRVYEAALDGYQQLVEKWMPKLAPTLGLGAMLPIALEGNVEVDRNGGMEVAGIDYELWPLPPGEPSRVKLVPVEGTQTRRAEEFEEKNRRFASLVHAYRSETAAWIGHTSSHGVLSIFGRLPATRIAIEWLWDDLRALRIIRSSGPRD